jgi:hypothetical protein
METVNYASYALHLVTLVAMEANLPALDTSRLLPTRSQCLLAVRMIDECQHNLSVQAQLFPHRQNDLDDLRAEVKRRRWLWDKAEDVRNDCLMDWKRRMALKELSERMGWADECSVVMNPLPWPIPMSRAEGRK